MSRERIVLVSACSVAVFAAIIAAGSLAMASRPADLAQRLAGMERELAESRRQVETLGGEFAPLRDEIAGLSRTLEALRHRLEPRAVAATAVEDAPRTAGDACDLEPMIRRVETLAERLESIEVRLPAAGAAAGGDPRSAAAAEGPSIAESEALAADRERPPADRVQALRDLRMRGGRSRDVALAMIELIQDPEIPARLRADIIRNLDGVDISELKQPLLDVLQSAGDAETRAEAIETLQVFYDDPAVHDAVVHLRDNDPDPRVRQEAVKRLGAYEGARLEQAGGER